MTCAREGCGVALTPRQIGRGARFHSRPCHGLARRQVPVGRTVPTHCRVCSTRLTWAQARRGEHCSLRCVMRTRHGTAAPTRTHCANCDGPLTRRQRWRRRAYCSKGCAKSAEWRRRPDVKARAIRHGHATLRRRYVQRLRAFFLAGPTLAAAVERGFRVGYQVAVARMRRRGLVPTSRAARARYAARRREVVAAGGTAAGAYRAAYALGYGEGLARFTPARVAA